MFLQQKKDEEVASALVGHGWAFKTPESWAKYRNRAIDTNYNFAPKLDADMVTSANSQKIAEDQYGNPKYKWGMGIDNSASLLQT